jgi:hypothetical protein
VTGDSQYAGDVRLFALAQRTVLLNQRRCFGCVGLGLEAKHRRLISRDGFERVAPTIFDSLSQAADTPLPEAVDRALPVIIGAITTTLAQCFLFVVCLQKLVTL